jgi:ABC-type transporter Mla subunit MlaD
MAECANKCPYDGVIASMQTTMVQVANSLEKIDTKIDKLSDATTSLAVVQAEQAHHKETLGRLYDEHDALVEAHAATAKKLDGVLNQGRGAIKMGNWIWAGASAVAGVAGFLLSHLLK